MEAATDQALSLERLVQRQLKDVSRDPVFAQQIPMFRLSAKGSGEPVKAKTGGQSHKIGLSRSLIVDPRTQGFRTSRYPKVSLTPELEQKVTLLSAYKALGSQIERTKDKPECRCNINSPPTRLRPHHVSDDFDLNGFREALQMERKCPNCRCTVCKCVKVVRDDYLRKISRRISKTKAKTAQQMTSPKPKSGGKGTKASTLPTRHAAIRRSLDGSPPPKPTSFYVRKSSEGFAILAGLLQVSQASFSSSRKKRQAGGRYELHAQDSEEGLNERGDLSPGTVLT